MTHPKYTPDVIARFWSKADRSGGPDACWLWQAGHTSAGYGKAWDGKRQVLAHRLAYEIAHGELPSGMLACHNCPEGDNPRCVNPAHLFAGTSQQNTQDMIEKGRAHLTFRLHPDLIPRGDDHYTRRSPEKVRRGERAPSAKLNAEQVENIRRRRAAGEKGYVLAAEYGISPAQVSRIVNRALWRHV